MNKERTIVVHVSIEISKLMFRFLRCDEGFANFRGKTKREIGLWWCQENIQRKPKKGRYANILHQELTKKRNSKRHSNLN